MPELPVNLPKRLKCKAYEDSLRQLRAAEKDGNVVNGVDFESRKQSLRNQVQYFGQGEDYKEQEQHAGQEGRQEGRQEEESCTIL